MNALERLELSGNANQLSENNVLLKETELIFSWLLQKKEGTTRRNYKREIDSFFRRFPGLKIKDISVGHISVFLEERSSLSQASKRFSKDVISSLLTFCVKLGYIGLNPAAVLDPIRVPDQTASKLLSEEQIFRIMDRAQTLRDYLIMKLLYAAGLRRSELCKLRWKDFYPRNEGVQMVVQGKGDKVRSILLPLSVWNELLALKDEHVSNEDSPVFVSRKGGALKPTQVFRIVKATAVDAKVGSKISPHWFRHGHATHALERGAPIHLVQRTLGHASVATTGKYLNARPSESSTKYLGI